MKPERNPRSLTKKREKSSLARRRRLLPRAAGEDIGYRLEPSEDGIKKSHRPLDLHGRETALRRTHVGNTPAPYQYSNSKCESEDYHDVRLDNAPSQQCSSIGEAIGAIKAEYEQLRIKNMAEAEDMLEKLSTTVAESKEVYNRQMTEYINCYNKAKAANDESDRRLAEIHDVAAGMLNRVYGGEEISQEEYICCLEKIREICQRSVSSLGIAGH